MSEQFVKNNKSTAQRVDIMEIGHIKVGSICNGGAVLSEDGDRYRLDWEKVY